jgi:nucleolar pre-ribosomal-associated protein 1
LDIDLSKKAFFESFKSTESWSPSQATFAFLDNCMMRLIQKPVHYADLVHEMQNNDKAISAVSLLVTVTAEQWPFVVKAGNNSEVDIAIWLARYLGYAKQAGEDESILTAARDRMAEATSHKRSGSAFKRAFKHGRLESLTLRGSVNADDVKATMETDSKTGVSPPNLQEAFGTVPKGHTLSSGLMKWNKCDEDEAVERGYVGELLMCFCSERGDIRTNAYINVKSLMQELEKSAYTEAKPIYLLVGEVAETAKDLHFPPMPYIFGELAARTALVLANPLHKMYGKANKYLNKAPKWDVGKIPSYWIDRILLREPEHDDGHVCEVEWLLDLLIGGLRTEEVWACIIDSLEFAK